MATKKVNKVKEVKEIKASPEVKSKKTREKVFDYSILIDIMKSADKFSKIKLNIKDKVEFEIIGSEYIEEVITAQAVNLPLVTTQNTAPTVTRSSVLNEEEIEEDVEDDVRKKLAIRESFESEELMLTDPDAYFDKLNSGDIK